MTFRLSRLSVVVAALAMVVASVVPATGDAQRGGVRAQVFVVQSPLPRGGDERALLGFARSHAARRMNETSGVPFRERTWNGDLVVNFSAPPGDLEFHVLFYDVSDGSRRFIDDMTTYISDRSQRTYVQRLRLPRARFRANRRYELVVTLRREEVGKAQVELAGEVEDRSGVVDFSNEAPARSEN